jgi:hypothetical protein
VVFRILKVLGFDGGGLKGGEALVELEEHELGEEVGEGGAAGGVFGGFADHVELVVDCLIAEPVLVTAFAPLGQVAGGDAFNIGRPLGAVFFEVGDDGFVFGVVVHHAVDGEAELFGEACDFAGSHIFSFQVSGF